MPVSLGIRKHETELTHLSRYMIVLSASVRALSRIPSATSSNIFPFSTMLKMVFGRSVPNLPSLMVDIILDICAGCTFASYRAFTYKLEHTIRYNTKCNHTIHNNKIVTCELTKCFSDSSKSFSPRALASSSSSG